MTTLVDLPADVVLDRDALARHLYIHHHDDKSPGWLMAGATEWDTRQARPEDVAFFYASADAIIAEEMPS